MTRVAHSARVANATAGTSVVAAGAIVVVAIAGLLATGIPFVGRMGVGSAIVVAAVAVGAVTVLPTLMGAFARRLTPQEPEDRRAAARPSSAGRTRITNRPRTAAIAGTAILLALAAPVLGLRLGMPDDGNDAGGTTTRVAYDRLAEGFGVGFNGPLVLATDRTGALQQIRAAAESTAGVALVSEPVLSPKQDAATLTVIPTTSPQDPRTSELVTRLRDELPAGVYVGGATAMLDDMAAKIADRLPIFIALVIGLSIVLLMAVFRSLWVPLVSRRLQPALDRGRLRRRRAVFQEGVGVPIVSFVPLFMFAILFGLSMDYNVFLQSRIREEYLRGRGPRESVIRALGRVGPHHPRRRRDHDQRLPRLRRRPRCRRPDDRPRPRGGDPDRRAGRADDRRARRHDPARRPRVGAPALARPRAAADLAGGRTHPGVDFR